MKPLRMLGFKLTRLALQIKPIRLIQTKPIRLSLILLGLAIIQSTVLNEFRIFYAVPDLLLIAAVMVSFFYSEKTAIIFACAAGFLKDIFSNSSFGLNTLLFTLICYAVSKISKKFIFETIPLRIAVVVSAFLLQNIAAQLILSFSGEALPLGVFGKICLFGAIYTACCTPLIIKLKI